MQYGKEKSGWRKTAAFQKIRQAPLSQLISDREQFFASNIISIYFFRSKMPTEKRHLKDRRARPTPAISRYTLRGRRQQTRRWQERDNYYVDRYQTHYLIFIALIMVFCFLDIYFNSKILRAGGYELNLFMAGFMKKNFFLAQVFKLAITFFCSVFLLIHKNFRILGKIKTHIFIYAIFCLYFVLVVYESYALLLI